MASVGVHGCWADLLAEGESWSRWRLTFEDGPPDPHGAEAQVVVLTPPPAAALPSALVVYGHDAGLGEAVIRERHVWMIHPVGGAEAIARQVGWHDAPARETAFARVLEAIFLRAGVLVGSEEADRAWAEAEAARGRWSVARLGSESQRAQSALHRALAAHASAMRQAAEGRLVVAARGGRMLEAQDA